MLVARSSAIFVVRVGELVLALSLPILRLQMAETSPLRFTDCIGLPENTCFIRNDGEDL